MTEPLVSVEDFVHLTGSTAPKPRIKALLVAASSAVLAEAHGQELVRASSTDTVVFNWEGRFYLPQRPVISIESVTINGIELADDEYRWTAGGNRRHAVIVRRCDGRDASFTAAEATVSYTHGWEELPGQITMAIVALVSGSLATSAGTSVITSMTLGPYSETHQPIAHSADMAVPGSTRSLLERLCGVDGFASVPSRPSE